MNSTTKKEKDGERKQNVSLMQDASSEEGEERVHTGSLEDSRSLHNMQKL